MSAAAAAASRVVICLNPNDCLMGKGKLQTDFEGNVRFRAVVYSLLPRYFSSSSRAEKDRLAQLVVHIVRSRKGRFLRRVESPMEAEQLNLDNCNQIWLVAEDKLILPKVKQTFRDQRSGTSKLQRSKHHGTKADKCANEGAMIPCEGALKQPTPKATLISQPSSGLQQTSGAIVQLQTAQYYQPPFLNALPLENQRVMMMMACAVHLPPKASLQQAELRRRSDGLDLLAGVAAIINDGNSCNTDKNQAYS